MILEEIAFFLTSFYFKPEVSHWNFRVWGGICVGERLLRVIIIFFIFFIFHNQTLLEKMDFLIVYASICQVFRRIAFCSFYASRPIPYSIFR